MTVKAEGFAHTSMAHRQMTSNSRNRTVKAREFELESKPPDDQTEMSQKTASAAKQLDTIKPTPY